MKRALRTAPWFGRICNPPMFVIIGLQILLFNASGLQIRRNEGFVF